MSNSLLKIPLILCVTWACHTATTPPNPPPKDKNGKLVTGNVFFQLIHTLASKSIIWGESILEVWAILSGRPGSSATCSPLADKAFMLGWSLTIAGALIRIRCYRELGPLFTFEQSVQKNHKLITSGPYSVVRHPSYTGILLMIAGLCLSYLTEGSWLKQCLPHCVDSSEIWFKIVYLFSSCVGVGAVFATVARSKVEDSMMRDEFGDEWHNWAQKVPYRLIPFVY